MRSLTRDEARARRAILDVSAMEVDLDLSAGPENFGSATTIRFTCSDPAAGTFVDVAPVVLQDATLTGIRIG